MPSRTVDPRTVARPIGPSTTRPAPRQPQVVVAAVALVALVVVFTHASRSAAARPARWAAPEGSGPLPANLAGINQVAPECDSMPAHPSWIFCDDFETDEPLVGPGRYFEYGDDDGDFIPLDGEGVLGSRAMRALWQPGEVGAGGLKLGFGRNPNGYIARSSIRPEEDFREIYYRMYLRNQPGWRGDPAKLSRATVFTSATDWSQAMIAHLWGDGNEHLLIDPVRCVATDGRPKCLGYNDFDSMDWLGYRPGVTRVFGTELADNWFCIEAHVRLNDPGQSNGIQEFWVDDALEARRDGLDFVRGYTDYGINAVFFENYWNDGSPQEQARYFDNIVVSTERIGCLGDPAAPTATASPSPRTTGTATTTPVPRATITAIATATARDGGTWQACLPFLPR